MLIWVLLVVVPVLPVCIWYFTKRSPGYSGGDRTASESSREEPAVSQKNESSRIIGSDEPDTATQKKQKVSNQSIQRENYKKVQHSLQQMFQCVYTQLVLPWYTAPEDRASQPLYNALLTEYNLAVNMTICKVRDLDLLDTVLNGIPIITKHLHNAKQSDGSSAFSSTTDEINVLRDFSKALIRNLLPQHIWEQNVYYCVLQEILATKALELVALLSDPDTLNHLVVTQLDAVPTETPRNPMKVQNSDKGDSPSSVICKDIDMQQDVKIACMSEDDKPKKKGNLFKYYCHKITKKLEPKRKNNKKSEDFPVRVCAAMDSDEESRDDDRVDSDDQCDNPDEKMEFKLFYEMWKVGKWAVTVTNVQKDLNELLFIVHLEESNQPEDLNWEVVTTQSDINDLYNYCEDTSHLPSISTIMEYSATETEWNEEEARESLEKFLQGLVTDPKLGSSELVFTFLCPAHRMSEEEQNDGIWDLLAKMASFLTSGLEEDDEFNEHSLEEKQNDETTHQHELDETQSTNVNTLEGPHKEAMGDMLDKNCWYSSTPECLTACTSEKEESAHSYDFDHPETSSSGTEGADDNVEHHTGHPTRHAACLSSDSDDDSLNKSTSSSSDKCYSDGIKNKRDNLSQKKSPRADKPSKEQKHDYKVIFDLLKEISGNSYVLKILRTNPVKFWLNIGVNSYVKKIKPSEDQIAGYIDDLCKYICPEGDAPQQSPRSKEDKNQTKEKALQLITSKCLVPVIISKTNLETTFRIFQNAEENKKLVYKLLSYLLKELLPGESGLDVTSKLNVKHPVQ